MHCTFFVDSAQKCHSSFCLRSSNTTRFTTGGFSYTHLDVWDEDACATISQKPTAASKCYSDRSVYTVSCLTSYPQHTAPPTRPKTFSDGFRPSPVNTLQSIYNVSTGCLTMFQPTHIDSYNNLFKRRNLFMPSRLQARPNTAAQVQLRSHHAHETLNHLLQPQSLDPFTLFSLLLRAISRAATESHTTVAETWNSKCSRIELQYRISSAVEYIA